MKKKEQWFDLHKILYLMGVVLHVLVSHEPFYLDNRKKKEETKPEIKKKEKKQFIKVVTVLVYLVGN